MTGSAGSDAIAGMFNKLFNPQFDELARHKPGQHVLYLGHHGVTRCSVEAVERLLHRHRDIEAVRLLSCRNRHAYMFTLACADFAVVRAGFTSDSGEGSSGLRRSLNLIQSVGLEIEESDVDNALFDRLNHAALSPDDLDRLLALRCVRPWRLWDYGLRVHSDAEQSGGLWQGVEPVLPLGLLDPRLFDLAVDFWKAPDAVLFKGFRRLEGIIRSRTGLKQHGKNLYTGAFQSPQPLLVWVGFDENQQNGRASLFIGAFAAFRNERVHNEAEDNLQDALREFLMLNQLFVFESEAVLRSGLDAS